MPDIIYTVLIGVLLLALLVSAIGKRLFKPKISPTSNKTLSDSKSEKAKEFVQKLHELGYFKYAAEEDLMALKDYMIEVYGVLVTIEDDKTLLPKDYRLYFCDGEALYEQGGFTEQLGRMDHTLSKIGIKMEITDHFEEWDDVNKWLNHSITINETKYTMFKNFKGYGWGEAAQRLSEILNQELEKQGSDERIYLINGGNDGQVVFLTDSLYEYIDKSLGDPQWKPLRVKEWCKEMGVKYMEVD